MQLQQSVSNITIFFHVCFIIVRSHSQWYNIVVKVIPTMFYQNKNVATKDRWPFISGAAVLLANIYAKLEHLLYEICIIVIYMYMN